ncbi:uncharacterized [Tachysurus ichikawai]
MTGADYANEAVESSMGNYHSRGWALENLSLPLSQRHYKLSRENGLKQCSIITRGTADAPGPSRFSLEPVLAIPNGFLIWSAFALII